MPLRKHLLLISIATLYSLIMHAQTILGVDVYHGNSDGTYGAISWSQVHTTAGKTFAYAKATQGISFTDPAFITNVTNGNNAGVVMGAYHFSTPETNAAVDEANYFVSVARSYIGAGHLPPALDLEDPAGTPLSTAFTSTQLTAWVLAWMTTVYDSTGVRPILYTTGTYAAYLNSSVNIYGLWVANPNTSATTAPSTIGVWTTWVFKQYSWTGTVSGIGDPNVDLDVFNGDTIAFNRLIGDTLRPACSNDNICVPMVLPVGSSCVSTACSTVNATPPAINIPFDGGSTCSTLYQSGRYDDDVWFAITPATTAPLTVAVTPTSNLSGFDPVLGLYSGRCTSPIQVTCADAHGVGVAEQMSYTPMADSTYFIRVFSYGIGSTYSGAFDICAYSTCATPSQPMITGDSILCAGDTTTLIVSNPCTGCTYSWSGGDTARSHRVSAAGTYYVTVTNSCGSSSVSSGFVVTQTSLTLVAHSSATTSCAGQIFSLNASGASTYVWSGQGLSGTVGDSVSASSISAGSYTYTVTGYTGSCHASATTVVSVAPLPVISVTPGGTVALCSSGSGSSVTLYATGATTYAWSPSVGLSSSSIADPTVSGLSGPVTYIVTGTTGGCTATDTVRIHVTQTPAVSISPASTTICLGGTGTPLTVVGSAQSYAWSPSAGLSDTTSASVTANPVATSTYTVTASDGACSATASAVVTVAAQPIGTITSTATAIGCRIDSAMLTASPVGTAYSWSGPDSTISSGSMSIAVFSAGLYTVTITDAAGCHTTATSSIVINQLSNLTVTAGVDQTIAIGDSVTLGGNPTASGGFGTYTYLWSSTPVGYTDSLPDPRVSPTDTTTYAVTATDQNGCTGMASVTITDTVTQVPCDTTVHPMITVNQCSLTISTYSGASYQWFYQGVAMSGDSTAYYTAIDSGYYRCFVSIGSCIYPTPDTFVDCSVTGIKELSCISDLSIIPNPSSGSFIVSLSTLEEGQVEIRVYDLLGQMVYEGSSAKTGYAYSKQITLNNIAKGSYILQVKIGDEIGTRQIVIQ